MNKIVKISTTWAGQRVKCLRFKYNYYIYNYNIKVQGSRLTVANYPQASEIQF